MMQNIPNPDVNSPAVDNENQINPDVEPSHSDKDEESIPLPPDEPKPAPVEEPPDEQNKPSIGEDNTEPKQIV